MQMSYILYLLLTEIGVKLVFSFILAILCMDDHFSSLLCIKVCFLLSKK